MRCLAHGFPTPLARWHVHDDYELHLITATSGKTFVGDWIGPFQPGHLVLVGPRLPHNWVSFDVPEGGVAERDLVIHFRHEPIVNAAQHLLCFSVTPTPIIPRVWDQNQFGTSAVAISSAKWLCLPSTKVVIS